MHLSKLLHTIAGTDPSLWNQISGDPLNRSLFEFYDVYAGGGPTLKVETHHSAAAYIPDVSITIAWGLKFREDYKAPWANSFPDPNATGSYMDVFYNDALVYRAPYVTVDGGRYTIPLPRSDKGSGLRVSKGAADLIKVIDAIGTAVRPDYDSYEKVIEQAGIKIVDEEWPTFRS